MDMDFIMSVVIVLSIIVVIGVPVVILGTLIEWLISGRKK